MIPLTAGQLADVVGGEVERDGDGRAVEHVTIDSRTVRAESLFVALPGAHVDGHDFLDDAAARGAAAALRRAGCGRAPERAETATVVVDDPADALLALGAWVRDHVDPFTVTVTGSNGKTTTKDLIAAALGASRRVVANPGSYNNELGVPLTCCLLEASSEVLVTEIGARGVGHIALLAPLLAPDVAVVTNVGAAHLELLGDLDTVARAKGELVEALGSDGSAVLNADDPRVAAMADRAPGRVVTFGLAADADWQAVDLELDAQARPRFTAVRAGSAGPSRVAEVRLPVPGVHNVGNALAALAVAELAGVAPETAAAGIGAAVVSRWRMEVRELAGATVLNDAYNANPDSTAAALRTLAHLHAGRRWAVLGHMAELGPTGEAAHRDVGRLAAELGLDGLVAVGAQAAGIAAGARAAGAQIEIVEVDDVEAAAAALRTRLAAGDAVLVKASRSVGLERVPELLEAAEPGGAR